MQSTEQKNRPKVRGWFARLLRYSVRCVLLLTFGVLSFDWYFGYSPLVYVTGINQTIRTVVSQHPPLLPTRVAWQGTLETEALNESSGLASSRKNKGILWSLNDSGSPAEIFAFTETGKPHSTWPVAMQTPTDWEAMDVFNYANRSYLLLADVGDNLAIREKVTLTVVAEPDLNQPVTTLPVSWQVQVRYPDGPRDCEAVAVDTTSSPARILMMTKRIYPNELYEVPLLTESTEIVVAKKIAEIAGINRSTSPDFAKYGGLAAFMGMPTGMDYQGGRLLVTTLKDAYLFEVSAPQKTLRRLLLPSKGQREAIAFDAFNNQRAFITEERALGTRAAELFSVEFAESFAYPPER